MNRAELQQKKHNWYLKNKKRLIAKAKAHYQENREHKLEVVKTYAKNNKEKINRRNKVWRDRNPDKLAPRHRRARYGLTPEAFNKLLKDQDYSCALCGDLFGEQTPYVDHDHGTDVVRGLLHNRCNTKLAVIEDREFLNLSISYLERTNAKEEARGAESGNVGTSNEGAEVGGSEEARSRTGQAL